MDPTIPLADDLVQGRCDSLARLFERDGATPPSVIWDPASDALPAEPLALLRGYWDRLRGSGQLPPARSIDPADMRFALGHLMLVDVVDDARDFTYRLFGSKIVARYGREMTGRRVSDFGGRLGLFFGATYRAVWLRGQPLFTTHTPRSSHAVQAWHRLILPLADAEGRIIRFLVGNIAESGQMGDALFHRADQGDVEPGG